MNQSNVTHLSASERAQARPRPEFRPRVEGRAEPKRFVAKGHDAQLQDAQYGKYPTEIMTTGGELILGQVVRRDKFTITLLLSSGTSAGREMIIYKHAIESVLILKPQVVADQE